MGKRSSPSRAFGTGVALAIPWATWEIFLRLDSQVLSVTTKAWFLPVLGLCVLSVAGWGASLGQRVASRFPRVFSNRIVRGLPVAAVVCGYGVTFAVVAGAHDPDARVYWPLAAMGSAVYAAICGAAVARISAPRFSFWRTLPSASLGMIAATLALVWSVPELSAGMLRPNSPAGRLFAMAYGRFPVTLSGPVPRGWGVPDLPTQTPLPGRHVVIISIDALRADFLSPYGERETATPAIDRFSREAILFEDAYAQRPTSGPSMASVFTGLFPANHGVRMNGWRMRSDVETLAESFSRFGYATAGFFTNAAFLDAFDFRQGFEVYEFLQPEPDDNGLLTNAVDEDVVDRALAWAAEEAPEHAFLWVHLISPHAPYLPADSPAVSAGPEESEWFNVWNMRHHEAALRDRKTSFDRTQYLKAYQAEVLGADRQVARLLEGLDALGWVDDSHVLVLADHGEAFGEADVFGHGNSLHRAETRIPVLWKLPGAESAGKRIEMTVQGADIAPSLLTLSGIDGANRDGRDISGVLRGELAPDEGFAFTDAGWRDYLHTDGFQYGVRTRTRSIWLDAGFPRVVEFDRAADPGERRRLRYPESRGDDPLFDQLRNLAERGETQRKAARGAPAQDLDEMARMQLRALGYLE